MFKDHVRTGLLALGWFVALTAGARAAHDLEQGDVVILVGLGKYHIYDNDGNFIKELDDGFGLANANAYYDAATNRLYTTNFTLTSLVVFDGASPNDIVDVLDVGGQGSSLVESVVLDSSGNLYAGFASGLGDIQKHAPDGTFLDAFSTNLSSCILDLATDDATMYYTANGPGILRYDVVNDVQLPDFADVGGTQFGLKLLPPFDGSNGLICTGTLGTNRFDAGGNIVQTYPSVNLSYGLSLDPNGNSLWVAEVTGLVRRFNLETEEIELEFSTGSPDTLSLLVIGERDGNDAPEFVDPTPCNDVVMASVGAEVTYVLHVGDEDSGDEVTLSAANVPAGATHTPDLPASGPGVVTTFSWTPGNGDVGDHVIVYTATDGDETTTCSVTVSVAECHLALGTGMGTESFDVGGYEFDTQLSGIVATFPVLLDDIPVFPVPKFAQHLSPGGASTPPSGPTAMIEFTAQVVMFNPEVFPENPEQSTPGLAVTIWSNGDMTSAPFGERDGMDIWLETFVDENGRKFFQLPFSIDGM